MSEPPDAADSGLAEQQISYYRARAPEYDEWFFRQGRYDRGADWNRTWFSEVEEVREALDCFRPAGDVLELACGTGLWTAELVRHADRVTAVDASLEVLELNRDRLRDGRVSYVQANLFGWRPDAAYDVVFFGFWLSHVPPGRFDAFWDLVRSALKPVGRVFFVDSLGAKTSKEKERHQSLSADHMTVRRLNDGLILPAAGSGVERPGANDRQPPSVRFRDNGLKPVQCGRRGPDHRRHCASEFTSANGRRSMR